MNQKTVEHTEEISISPKKIFRALHRRKLIINVCTAIFLVIGAVKLYFSEPLYEAKASILIKNKDNDKAKNKIDEAFGASGVEDLKTEIEIVKSKKLINKALKDVSFDIGYIADGLFKKKEIYRGHSPFFVSSYKVHNKSAYNKLFKVQVLDKNFFKVETDVSLLSELGLSDETYYKGVHKFGDTVKTKEVTFVLSKNASDDIFLSNNYYFSINRHNFEMADDVTSRLKVEQIAKEAYVIGISYQDTSPERAKEIVSSLAKSSIEHNVDSKTAQATATLDFIRNQMGVIKANLEKSEKILETFKKDNGLMDIAVETEVSARKLSALDQQLAQMEIETRQIDRLTEALKKGDYGYLAAETVFPSINDALITKLLKSLSDLEIKKSALVAEYTDKHPEVMQVNSQIKKLKADIASNMESVKVGIHERKNSMERIIAKNEGMFKGLPQKEREYINLKREYLVNEKVYSYLLEKESEASILKASTVSSNSLLDIATASDIPVSPNVNRTLFVFSFLGLVLGISISLGLYFWDGVLEDKQDILRAVDVHTVYMIPYIQKQLDVYFCGAFRNIRSHILHLSDKNMCKCISISASFANDGKTTCVSNIASSLAFAGYKTVVVDLDFKESKIESEFELSSGGHPGVSNYFDSAVGSAKLPIKCNHENLFMVTTGSGEHKRTKYLSPKKIFTLIEELKKEFDFVLLNCPNTSITIDAFEYAKYVDLTIFVLRAYSTKKRSLEKIFANLKLFDVDISKTGIILNGIQWRDYGDGLGCESIDKLQKQSRLSFVIPKIKKNIN